jgi:hypothetical protein
MFEIGKAPSIYDLSPEGSIDENPLHLYGISKVDFQHLLLVIIPESVQLPTYFQATSTY